LKFFFPPRRHGLGGLLPEFMMTVIREDESRDAAKGESNPQLPRLAPR